MYFETEYGVELLCGLEEENDLNFYRSSRMETGAGSNFGRKDTTVAWPENKDYKNKQLAYVAYTL